MGWLYYTDKRVQTYADEKAEITGLCTLTGENSETQLVRCSKVGSVWYAAVRVRNLDGTPVEDGYYVTDADGSFTFCAVFLTAYDQGCWGYNDFCETSAPFESRAPLRILDTLSNLKDSDGDAAQWRKRCRDWAAIPDYKEGDVIKLAKPVPMQSGISVQFVTATHYRRRNRKMRCYRCNETNTLVRLSKETLRGSELISSSAQAATPVLAEFFASHRR